MAEIKRTWSMPTSPRSPYKLPQTLILLSEFEGQVWNRETQTAFAKKLASSDFYEGSVPANLDFAARDRINRSPKTFGFVDFDSRKIRITDAGKRLISEDRTEELFTRQLLKWQYPSPKHSGDKYQNFSIRPFLELLRLVSDLDGISKREVAIFALPFIDYKMYSKVRSQISEFRIRLAQLPGPQRRRFVLQTHVDMYKEVYKEEIANGSFLVRQQRGKITTAEQFIMTKVRNSIDYADATIRYCRATGLFKLSATTFRLQILDSKKQIVEEILATISREPFSFSPDSKDFLKQLGNPDTPVLPDDRPEILQQEIRKLINEVSSVGDITHEQIDIYRAERLVSASVQQLKNKRDELEELIKKDTQKVQVRALQSYELFDDVITMYDKIITRVDYDIPDKPLFFEWNTWRALAMLDDGEIICNAKLDREGKPLSTAPGGGADSVCYYDGFALAVEVTLTRGERQFEAEHESVPRHVGKLVRSLRDKNDNREVYGIFIASGLNPSTIANFYTIRRTNISHYGGKAKIVPLELSDFKKMLEVAKNVGGIRSKQFKKFLQWADTQADQVVDENEWYSVVQRKIPTWTDIPA